MRFQSPSWIHPILSFNPVSPVTTWKTWSRWNNSLGYMHEVNDANITNHKSRVLIY